MSSVILKKIRLLFAEDDAIQRDELSTYLQRRVEKIYVASNGEEALEKYKSLKPDIILTDLRMPKLDGLQLVKKIRETDRITPIIIITAMNDKETILESVDLGITNYLVKPVDVKELVEVLENTVLTLLEIRKEEFIKVVEKEKINILKNNLTKYVKTETGKGPIDVRIKINNSNCYVNFIDSLTLYEKNMIAKDNNIGLVDHNRNVFFSDRKEALETLLMVATDLSFTLVDVKSKAKSNECRLHFKLN